MHYGNSYILPNQQWLPTDCDPMDGYKVDPSTVGQFTGLLDCKGNEIYEGDIVVHEREGSSLKYYREVVFHHGSFCFRFNFATYPMGDVRNISEWEIVGNIHDNPELIDIASKGMMEKGGEK